jgi:leucyl aminopeptidase
MFPIKTEYKEIPRIKADALIFFIPSDENGRAAGGRRLASLLGASVHESALGDATGAVGETNVIYTPATFATRRIILSGIGEPGTLTLETLRRAGAAAARKAQQMKLPSIACILDGIGGTVPDTAATPEQTASAVAEGIVLGVYSFSAYITSDERKAGAIRSVSIVAPTKERWREIERAVKRTAIVCSGVYLARDLGNMPGLDLYPQTLASIVTRECRAAGCATEVFNEKKIASLKMGGILAVSRGSERPPRFITIEWKGAPRRERPVVLVGKGITFDTGGISIKPAANMGDMKMDMSGAAAVAGAMKAAASLKLPINLVGLIPACENMISGGAIRPGDVIRIMNGKTVEIDNTDAEGRLVLADALVYAERYKPKAVVDLATLTGACVVALGHYATGMMGTDRTLIGALKKAGDRTYERVWELPLYDEYEKLIKSDIADVKNLGGRWAGAITAGWFLRTFAGNYPWAHLDIAGTAILEENGDYTRRGASGVGVRLLVEWLRDLSA